MLKIKITAILILLLIFTLNIAGFSQNWYKIFWWFDVILHFTGGLGTALLIYGIWGHQVAKHNRAFIVFLFIVGVTSLVGVFWEFAEYIANYIAGSIIQYAKCQTYTCIIGNLEDTLQDLFLDILGAIVIGLSLLRRSSK